MKLKIGENVVVKQEVIEPDLGEFEIDGWQGRAVEIGSISENENSLITIEWDILTLK